MPQTHPATVTLTSNGEEEELEDIWGRPHFPGEDDLKELLDGLRREAKHVHMPGVPEKVYTKIQAVQAEYVRKKNASIQAYQQIQAAYQPIIDESVDVVSAESGVGERWDEIEQVPEQEERAGEDNPELILADLLAAVAQAEQRLAAQVQKVSELQAANSEAKRVHGFGSLEWSEAESCKQQAIRFQQNLEDDLQAKREQCNQAGVPLSAEEEAAPCPSLGRGRSWRFRAGSR